MDHDYSRITRFLAGWGADDGGRRIFDYHGKSAQWLESAHDYIQWMFPLMERSNFNLRAPILTTQDIDTVQGDLWAQAYLIASLNRMEDFYAQENTAWLHGYNHNHLRISRILESARLLMIDQERIAKFYAARTQTARRYGSINSETLKIWSSIMAS